MDLTKIDRPFGELARATQLALFEAWLDGKKVQAMSGEYWHDWDAPLWLAGNIYRIKPDPLVPDSIDWSQVAPEWRFMARDKVGTAWLSSKSPGLIAAAWSGPGDWVRVSQSSYKRGTVNWKDSLVVRP